MIKIENLSCGYGKQNVIHNIDACIEEHKITVILGPNGCGKTTLLKAIAGLIDIKQGQISIKDKLINSYKRNDMAKLVSFMPQIRHVPVMKVEDLLMCARYPYLGMNKIPQKADYEAVSQAMNITGILEYKDRGLKTLSGGERQKVYFAFMLAQQTDIMVLDEPTTYLDIEKQFEILDMIKLMSHKKTVVMVLHDICHGLKYADNVIIMNEGRVLDCGTPQEILSNGILEKIYNIKIHKLTIDGCEQYVILK